MATATKESDAEARRALRQRAEEQAGPAATPAEEPVLPEAASRLIHELHVHQIELEIQNEELSQTQQALEGSLNRYFDLYDLAPVGYLTVSQESLILEANLRAADLLGTPTSQLVKARLARWIAPEDEEIFYLQRQQLLATGEPRAFELRMLKPDHTRFWTHWEATLAADRKGGAPAWRTAIIDISERKRAEQEREKFHAELLQSQKMESVGRLAGGVAHDFNNLLTVINGYSRLLMGRLATNDPVRTSIQEILNAGESAATLTRQLLAFGRRQERLTRLLNVDLMLVRLRPMLQRLTGEAVEVRVIARAAEKMVYADAHQIEQVILNLVINARDSMPGGGTVTIETAEAGWSAEYLRSHPDARKGRCLLLTVSDTGAGMDEDTRQRSFEPFFTTKETGQGTGLGLSVVQGIVAQSGGCIEVSSEPGRGASFKIWLPLADQSVAAEAGAPAPASEAGGSETVLVVEDQREVGELAAEALRAYGYRVVLTGGAAEALSTFNSGRERIDLVLTDMVMPGMSGPELAASLKQSHPQTKILFMSGYPDAVIAQQEVLSGGVNFLEKPFSPEQLAAKVRHLLGARSLGRVLVVDDEESVRGFLRVVLEDGGYQVLEAGDGEQALKLIRQQRPDLVLTDLVMPERDGIEIIQALREEIPGMAVIAISGRLEGPYLQIARNLGADAVLIKPVSPKLLLAKVAEALEQRR